MVTTLHLIKHHKALWPLFFLVILGSGLAAGALYRLAAYHPEVALDHKTRHARPWEKMTEPKVVKLYDAVNRKSGIHGDELLKKPSY